MSEHSKLPPSSASRRFVCSGSRALEAKYKQDKDSPHAREGEAAHWVASEMLKTWWNSPTLKTPETAPNGEPITSEMLEGAELYASSIMAVLRATSNLAKSEHLHIEERVDISTIHPECWGTPDCWFYSGSELHIWDYKFGHGYVEVFENWQLIEYCAGILAKLGINGIQDQTLPVTFYIIQPRSYGREPVRSWRVKTADLRGTFNVLRAHEEEAMSETARCQPSPECSYCTARHACPTLQRTALTAVDIVGENTPWDLSPFGVANELRILRHAAELLEARITGLTEQATSLLNHGERLPYFRLEQSVGRQSWKVPADEIILMGELLGHSLTKPPEVITPAQAIKAGIPPEVVQQYSHKPKGAMKLIEDQENTARKIFGGTK